MNIGYVKAIMGDAKDRGLRGAVYLVGGTKIDFYFDEILGDKEYFLCNTKDRILTLVYNRDKELKHRCIDCGSIQYIETVER